MVFVFILGFLFSFLGYTPPGILNMTALKIRLQREPKDFNYFLLGVLITVFFQVYISVYLTKYLSFNYKIIKFLEQSGIVVLIILSIYFYSQNKKEKKEVQIPKKQKYNFINGVVLSLLNMFAIPFFCGIIALLSTYKLINFDAFTICIFVFGSVSGTFYILYLYGKFAHKIQQKTGKLANNINLFLSIITAILALITFLKFVV